MTESVNRVVTEGLTPSAPPEPQGLPTYFPALDGLRFLCCTAVVIAHSFQDSRIISDSSHPLHAFVANLGAAGVDVFFALSGFLITKLLLQEIRRNGRADLKLFYVRRTLRIFPVYYAAVLGVFVMSALLGDRFNRPFAYVPDGQLFTHALPAYLLFAGNWFSAISVPTPLAILWSVCVEEQFYLLFPITFAFSQRRYPALRPIALGLLLAWAVRLGLAATGAPEGLIYRNTFAHGDHLLLGALLAQALQARPVAVLRIVRFATLPVQIALITASLAFTALDIELFSGPILRWLSYVVSATLAASLVAIFSLGEGPLVTLFSAKPLRLLGGLTYAGYAFHMYGVSVAWFVGARFSLSPWAAASLRAVLAIPITYLLAYVSKVVIENRFMRLKARYQPRVGAAVT